MTRGLTCVPRHVLCHHNVLRSSTTCHATHLSMSLINKIVITWVNFLQKYNNVKIYFLKYEISKFTKILKLYFQRITFKQISSLEIVLKQSKLLSFCQNPRI